MLPPRLRALLDVDQSERAGLPERTLGDCAACPGLSGDCVYAEFTLAPALDLAGDDGERGNFAQGEGGGELGRNRPRHSDGAAASDRPGSIRRAARPRSGVGAFLSGGSPWTFQNLSAGLYSLGNGLRGGVGESASGVSLPKRAADFFEGWKIASAGSCGVELFGKHGFPFGSHTSTAPGEG